MLNIVKKIIIFFIAILIGIYFVLFVLPVSAISATEPIGASYISCLETTVNSVTRYNISANLYKQATLINEPYAFPNLEYKAFYSTDYSIKYLNEIASSYVDVEKAIASGEYTMSAIDSMFEELVRLDSIKAAVQADVDKYTAWNQEYYYASKTFKFLKQKGYSDAVACGIIGNMMIETSGGTLKLNPTIYNPTRRYYGLCQWSLYYRPEVADMSFEDQLEYLHNDMEAEFKTFGFCYKRGFTFEDFLALEDPSEAAIAFAEVYERCGPGSYKLRAKSAKVAYKYFVEGA